MKYDLILAEVDGEGMLIDVERGMSFFLNETGVLIYKMLREGKAINEIKTRFLKEYDVDAKEVEKDILEFRNILNTKAILWGKKDT